MISAIVQFSLPEPVSLEKAQELFSGSAPKYRGVAGLIRKYYLLSEDGCTAGGVYLWENRAVAEQFYSDQWKNFIRERYDCEPSISYFASPVIVDNQLGQILRS